MLPAVIKCVVSALLIAWILRGTDLREVFLAARLVSVPLLALAFLLHFVGYYISTNRWKILLAAQGVRASIPYLFKSFLVGVFFSNFLPSTIGGDAYRAYDSWRLGAGKAASVVVMFVDRFLGLVALLLFAVLALALSEQMDELLPLPHLWVLAGAAGVGFLLWMIFGSSVHVARFATRTGSLLPRPLQRPLAKAASAFLPFRGRTDALVRAFALSVLLQTNVVIYYYIIARALNVPIAFPEFFLIVPAALFVMMIPISINAIGLRENVFAYLFALYAVSTATAVAFAWIAYGMVIVQGLIGGMVYAFRAETARPTLPRGHPTSAVGVKIPVT